MDRNQKIILVLVGLVTIAAIVATVIFVSNKDSIKRVEEFKVPDYDTSAIEGSPEVTDDSLSYTPMNIDEGLSVKMCATPRVEDGKLVLFLTSLKENTALINLRVFDKDKNFICETGIIKPGFYLKDVEIPDNVDLNEVVRLQILGYEPGTFYSKGTTRMGLMLSKPE